jgi:hypothetical protein
MDKIFEALLKLISLAGLYEKSGMSNKIRGIENE